MEISACNRIDGQVVEMKKGKATTHVRVAAGARTLDVVVTSSSVEALGLETGDRVGALFREVDVVLMKGTGAISAGNRSLRSAPAICGDMITFGNFHSG